MGLSNIEELDAMHIDVLRELGNIGSGNAASSLASFMAKRSILTFLMLGSSILMKLLIISAVPKRSLWVFL